MTGAISVDEALLALKIGFLVLLYLFVWMIVRSATRDVRAAPPQESIVLSPSDASALRAQQAARRPAARLTVVSSPALHDGRQLTLDEPTTVGRGPGSGLRLDEDEYVSTRHALITPSAEGVWVEDLGSTNGTFVNGAPVTSSRLLTAGDIVRIGDTRLRVEP
ncbi:MAG TPA: FHA domain-containing protein [Gaiellaceae bacterium]|nr:FHA domain-containing protein [Gaiellaceae bacterium]